ncbi:NTP/NDP exchange transporter [Endozoicomonas sp. SCSIO W0465]|uniref:NTP/NDP exchange transporter n=1 Tax=Endozoicomonas sp. SCSIO W0465 TaxID=2918516 RepID=UPI00207602EA|nr:NTP/NDP exchange transporter [Endozoicomonas sp. SCSIO W0465]USE36739.1 NTP/NDP exchange transporter [Endozoicomonas sp. SCSIO W0465]
MLYLQIAMMFCCIFNFDILWNLKESLLITRLGAEAIPFIKLGVVMPIACIFLITYSFLANRLCKRTLFVVALIPFLVWMPLFSVVIYPNLESFAPMAALDLLSPLIPEHLQFIVGIIYYWPLTLFFALAELWGSAVICILFWTAVNDLHNTQSATRQYPLITMVGSSASIISGPLLYYCVSREVLTPGSGWQESLKTLSFLFMLSGLLILLLNEYCYRLTPEKPADPASQPATTTHLPLMASARYLLRCPYLASIALVMLAYCVAINMVELAWKSQLVQQYPNEADYSMFMGKVALINGIGSLVCGLLTPTLLNISWWAAAFATPIILTTTALPFFLLAMFQKSQISLFGLGCVDLPMIALQIGMYCHALGKSAKYTLFDATKEITFVPLDAERKYKGKAAIELVVSRVGKSGSSFFQQILITLFGSLSLAMSWLAGAFILAIALWLVAIRHLGRHYHDRTDP